MCGIAGFELPERGPAGPVDREAVLDGMLRRLARRGPDSQGSFRSGDVFLGHRRLSIVDLSPQGNQPMLNEEGNVALVCNGELYDYHGLREGLVARGHRFVSTSDSEVILHLYEEKGIDCVNELRGMFAFAIVDARTRQIHLARDRFGQKPLYWTTAGGGFAFASELYALLAHPGVARRIDPHALSRYLCFYYVPAPRTMVEGVFALEPGHVLTWSEGRARTRAYWRAADVMDRPSEPASSFSRARFEDELDAALADTVRIHLNADVPVGAFLSGGVDSSGVVAYMSRFVPSAKTFCLVHEDPAYDEREHAALVARHCGTEHVEVALNAGEQFEVGLLDFLTEVYGEPFGSPSAIAVQSVIRAMKGRVKCVLSGDGADELFAGYEDYAWLDKTRAVQRVPRVLARAVLAADRLVRLPGSRRLRHALPQVDWSIVDFLVYKKGFFGFGEQAELLADGVLAGLDLEREALYLHEKLSLRNAAPSYENLYRFMVLQQLPDYMLTKTDRASMGHSVEVRVPYVDHVLFELLQRAPASERFDPAVPKPILKRVLERHLPREILYRPKQGFAIHLERFVNDAFWRHFAELLADPGVGELLRVPAVEGLARRLRAGAFDASERVRAMYKLWMIAVLLHWRRHVLAPS